MWKTTFDGSFGFYDAQVVDAPSGVGAPLALPKPAGTTKGSAEQILVQALETNPGVVVLGQTASLAASANVAGFRLQPGAAQVLPDCLYTAWKLWATTAGCSVVVIYVAGPK